MVVIDEAQHVKNPHSAMASSCAPSAAGPASPSPALRWRTTSPSCGRSWIWTTPGLLGRLGNLPYPVRRRRRGRHGPGGRRAARGSGAPVPAAPPQVRPGIAGAGLPPKTETDRTVSPTAEQAGLYEAVVRETLAEIAGADGFERRGLVMKLLTALKQICNHPAQYLKEDRPRIADRSGKVEPPLDAYSGHDPGRTGFCPASTRTRRWRGCWRSTWPSGGCVRSSWHGGTPVARREEMVSRFQAGEAPVFLLSQGGGDGLNLTRLAMLCTSTGGGIRRWRTQATDLGTGSGRRSPSRCTG
ncbi:DEAD/DEAH box helicase OS=Streptomyces cyaneofuscatus OX=66883 GN=G3I52_08240 PE=4 SV=1 [Streptomyces cyaneofuscatus]